MEKLKRISEYTLKNMRNGLDAGLIVHDIDLRMWAVQAQKEIEFGDVRFTALPWWLHHFKKAHRITSRKINKFITRKTLENREASQKQSEEFLQKVQSYFPTYGPENIYNSDQSCFQLEIHSGRTLTEEDNKQVARTIQSIPSTTHSYTIQPTISLFLVLKEPSGTFGPIVEQNVFRPSNVFVTASKSERLTSEYFNTSLKEVFFPNVESKSLLLIDSWSGHCPETVQQATRRNEELLAMLIPKGTTGKVQPLDLYGFRIWKNYVRHFSDRVTLLDYDINLHSRNNIIKLQSLVRNQLSSPRYRNLFRYARFQSGHIVKKPDEFENSVDLHFGNPLIRTVTLKAVPMVQ
ncbi:uncharacterized protein LOC107042852 [Diachasma alloeum]|uniref:uncharacterized protein LOC107042852 n=1 Tax=Diachasma alloeum TaxID=454923 RepID=UPI0007381ABD|nr:uncharacterized protein LOC107042852 [Diachasma alloeum]